MANLPALAEAADLALMVKAPADDPLLVSALERASNRFRGAVRWLVSETTATIRLDGQGRHSLRLPGKQISAVQTVTENGFPLTEGLHYEWSEDGILDRIGGAWADRRRAVQITYTYGYPEIPGDIEEAVLDQAAALYRIKRGLSSEQVGGISRVYGKEEATGVTQAWSDAVAHHAIAKGDRA